MYCNDYTQSGFGRTCAVGQGRAVVANVWPTSSLIWPLIAGSWPSACVIMTAGQWPRVATGWPWPAGMVARWPRTACEVLNAVVVFEPDGG